MNPPRAARFTPDQDTHIATFPRWNAEGNPIEGEEEIYHSPALGFYLRTTTQQIRKGRTWETAELFECDESIEHTPGESWKPPVGEFRVLETFRALTRGETVRKIIENEMPAEGGLRAAVLNSLFTTTGEARF